MQIIRFMKFQPVESDPFYLVGTDQDAMRTTAKNADKSVDGGEEVSYERVLKSADTPAKLGILKHGIEVAKAGMTTDYYLFCY